MGVPHVDTCAEKLGDNSQHSSSGCKREHGVLLSLNFQVFPEFVHDGTPFGRGFIICDVISAIGQKRSRISTPLYETTSVGFRKIVDLVELVLPRDRLHPSSCSMNCVSSNCIDSNE
jgi:hypothetical protein